MVAPCSTFGITFSAGSAASGEALADPDADADADADGTWLAGAALRGRGDGVAAVAQPAASTVARPAPRIHLMLMRSLSCLRNSSGRGAVAPPRRSTHGLACDHLLLHVIGPRSADGGAAGL